MNPEGKLIRRRVLVGRVYRVHECGVTIARRHGVCAWELQPAELAVGASDVSVQTRSRV